MKTGTGIALAGMWLGIGIVGTHSESAAVFLGIFGMLGMALVGMASLDGSSR